MACAGVVTSQASAGADPAVHQVRYTVTSGDAYDFELTYLTNQPASKAAYNADAYSFLKRDQVSLAPGVPWVFETTLADPQWGYLGVSSTAHGGKAPPNAHCDITVDGQVAVSQDAPYSPFCVLGQW